VKLYAGNLYVTFDRRIARCELKVMRAGRLDFVKLSGEDPMIPMTTSTVETAVDLSSSNFSKIRLARRLCGSQEGAGKEGEGTEANSVTYDETDNVGTHERGSIYFRLIHPRLTSARSPIVMVERNVSIVVTLIQDNLAGIQQDRGIVLLVYRVSGSCARR
jgi:hypothetical protein